MTRPCFALGWTVAVFAVTACGDERKPPSRLISDADSVLAIYVRDGGLGGLIDPSLVVAIWPDGRVIWSKDRRLGGAPYFTGRIEPTVVASLLKRLAKEGHLDDPLLNASHFGPDASFTTILIKHANRQLAMSSWHEVYEDSEELAVTDHGVMVLEKRRRLDELRGAKKEYLYFLAMWNETRTRITDLIPEKGEPTNGKAIMKAGTVQWEDQPAKP